MGPVEDEFGPISVERDSGDLQASEAEGEGEGLNVRFQGGNSSIEVGELRNVVLSGAADESKFGVSGDQESVGSWQNGVLVHGVRDRSRQFHDALVVRRGITMADEGVPRCFGGLVTSHGALPVVY